MSSEAVAESFEQLAAAMAESAKTGALQSGDTRFKSLEARVNAFYARFNAYAGAVKMKHNFTVPVNYLPNEILQEIFRLSLPHLATDDKQRDYSAYYASLYQLIQVCRRWAGVLKATPDLWTFISSQSTPDLQKMALELSTPLLLHVHYNFQKLSGPLQSTSFPKLMLGTVPRWEKATFVMGDETLPQMTPVLLSPAPNIESVSLILKSAQGAETPKRLHLFQGQAPRLKYLNVVGFPIHWNSSIFNGLTTLTLINIRDDATGLDDLLEVLRHTPELENLIIDCISLVVRDRAGLPPKINLPKLQFLSITSLPSLTTIILVGALRSLPSCKTFSADFDCGELGLAFENILGHLVPDFRRLIEMSNPSWTKSYDIAIGVENAAVNFTAGGGLFTFAVEQCPTVPGVVRWFSTVVQGCGKIMTTEVCFSEDALSEALDETLLRLEDFDVVSIELINLREAPTVFQYIGRPVVRNGVPLWPFSNVNSISLIQWGDPDGPAGWALVRRILDEAVKMVEQRTKAISAPVSSSTHPKAFKLCIEGYAVGDRVRGRLAEALGRDRLLIN